MKIVNQWSNQIKCSFNTTIVKPKLYNTKQDKTIQSINVTKQHPVR